MDKGLFPTKTMMEATDGALTMKDAPPAPLALPADEDPKDPPAPVDPPTVPDLSRGDLGLGGCIVCAIRLTPENKCKSRTNVCDEDCPHTKPCCG